MPSRKVFFPALSKKLILSPKLQELNVFGTDENNTLLNVVSGEVTVEPDVPKPLLLNKASSFNTEAGAKSSGLITISNWRIMLTNGSSYETLGMKKTIKIRENNRVNDSNKKYLCFTNTSDFIVIIIPDTMIIKPYDNGN
mgnify:CR=1 FL=1